MLRNGASWPGYPMGIGGGTLYIGGGTGRGTDVGVITGGTGAGSR
jgi:hypothetical protein